jgi:hypothetical protein
LNKSLIDTGSPAKSGIGLLRSSGDRRRSNRTIRNLAIREYVELLGGELALETKAREIIAKAARYRPVSGDESRGGERQVLARIAATELPVPGTRQLRRILGT